MNVLPGATRTSIGFATIVLKLEYREALGLDETTLDKINQYRVLRNMIHLPQRGGMVRIEAIGADIESFLAPFVNSAIVEWSNQIINNRGLKFPLLAPV